MGAESLASAHSSTLIPAALWKTTNVSRLCQIFPERQTASTENHSPKQETFKVNGAAQPGPKSDIAHRMLTLVSLMSLENLKDFSEY